MIRYRNGKGATGDLLLHHDMASSSSDFLKTVALENLTDFLP